MSDTVQISLITAIPAVIAAVFAGYAAVVSARNHAKIQELNVSIDGRLDQLLAASTDTGRIMERDEERKRVSDKNLPDA